MKNRAIVVIKKAHKTKNKINKMYNKKPQNLQEYLFKIYKDNF